MIILDLPGKLETKIKFKDISYIFFYSIGKQVYGEIQTYDLTKFEIKMPTAFYTSLGAVKYAEFLNQKLLMYIKQNDNLVVPLKPNNARGWYESFRKS